MQHALIIILIFFLNGCDLMSDRLNNVGRVPDLTEINIYEKPLYPIHERIEVNTKLTELGYENGYNKNNTTPASLDAETNSLWHGNKKIFFKTRAVGDIVSIVVQIQDQAVLNNQTQQNRQTKTNLNASSVLGLQTLFSKILPKSSPPSDLIDLNSKNSSSGNGKINRQENIQTTVAATVIKVLPSGNLVIKGSQEVRVNFDVREVTIEGIIRPEDITNENTITLEQIAEARISYGGRGHIFEYQQPPYGKQVLDIVSPL
jgi:flagellar L-ring protein precursor FlgH